MQSFLQLVAHDLYTKIGNDLSRTVLVFPNKRANLFFNEYLAGESDKPIWSPAAMSISDLFQKLSVQKSGDPIRLVCELYKVFKEETRSQETLDDFYFWGELLISDFDDACDLIFQCVHHCVIFRIIFFDMLHQRIDEILCFCNISLQTLFGKNTCH